MAKYKLSELPEKRHYPNIKVDIKKIEFPKRGYMTVVLTDKRSVTVPLSMFPWIKELSVAERDKWMILDGQFLTFKDTTPIYSIKDFFKLEEDNDSK